MRHSPRAPWFFAALAIGCAPGHAPSVPRAGGLSLPADGQEEGGPLRVVFASPVGALEEIPGEITVVFSRPVRAADASAPPLAATVQRAGDRSPTAGRWEWFGTRTAVFRWEGKVPRASELTVTVPATTRALQGDALAAPYTFSFTTPRPMLTVATYREDLAAPGHYVVDLAYNQPVSLGEAKRTLRFDARRNGERVDLPFGLVGDGSDFTATFDTLQGIDGVSAVVDPSLRGEEGPLVAGAPSRVPIPAIGPLRVTFECERTKAGDCEEGASAHVEFSKPVPTAMLAKSLVLPGKARLDPKSEPDATQYLSLYDLVDIAPGRKYRIVVKAGLVASDGDRLAHDVVFDFTGADVAPTLVQAAHGAVVEAARTDLSFRVGTINIGSYQAVRAPIDERGLVPLLFGAADMTALRALPGAVASAVAPRAPRNAWAETRVAIPDEVRAGGAFAFGLAPDTKEADVGVVRVTDLGVTSKWSAYEGLLWITRLSTGAPVPGARVVVQAVSGAPSHPTTRELLRATADDHGVVTVPKEVGAALAREKEPAIAFVRDAADWTFAALPEVRAARPLAYVFTERSLYRPGETVHVKGYARLPAARGLVTPVGREVEVSVDDDEGHALFLRTVKLDAFGAFAIDAPLPKAASHGFAHVNVHLDGGNGAQGAKGARSHPADAGAGFLIDDYRTVEFKVTAASDRAEYVRGDTARIQIEGAYLFGAPMHDVTARYEVTRARTRHRLPGLEDYANSDDDGSRGSQVAAGEAKLGADGRVTVAVKADLPAARGPETLSFEADIDDVSHTMMVAGTTSALVHPGEHYIAVRAARGTRPLQPSDTVRVDVLAAKPDGTRVAAVPAHVELVFEPEPGPGAAPPSVIGPGCDVVTRADGPVTCAFVVPNVGRYALRATAKDARGNPLVAAERVLVSLPPRVPVAGRPKIAPPPPKVPEPPKAQTFDEYCRDKGVAKFQSSVELERSNEERAVGDVARVCVRAPRPGMQALVTVEREGILRWETRTLTDAAQVIDVPITADMFPDAHVAVAMVGARTSKIVSTGVDKGPPIADRGDTVVRVAAPEKALSVEVASDATEYRPGADVRFAVTVKDGRGRPARAQVTLYAVDEGILLLQWYRRPQPADEFSQWRYGDVATDDSRNHLYYETGRLGGSHRVKAPSVRQGSTSVEARSQIARSKLPPTAFFLPSVLVGDSGVAQVHVTLPDNVTTWKIFAVAATEEDGFGSTEATFVTSQPLITRAALPRFLREGDRFDATMIADSLAKETISGQITMQAWGAIVGSGARALTLAPGAHEPVSFPLVAGSAGLAQVRFRLTAGDGGDAIDTTVPVRAPYTLETVAFAGDTRGRATEAVDLRGMRSDAGGLVVRVGASPLSGIAEGFAQLDDYPYGCTEQLVSRLVPLLMTNGMAKDLGVPIAVDRHERAADAVAKLLLHQRADGGFGPWAESSASSPWLTSYAMWALVAAKRSDVPIAESVVERAARYLDADGSVTRPDDAAFREDVLASLGLGREDEIRALAAAEARTSIVGRALLVHAAATVDRPWAATLSKELEAAIHVSGASANATDDAKERSYLSSNARATALVLRALVAASPSHPLIPRLVSGLLAQRRAARWPTTHDAAWSLLALDDARKAMAGQGPTRARLLLGEAELGAASLSATGAPLVVSVPSARLLASPGAPLAFDGAGGPLHYEGILSFARSLPPTSALEHGLAVERVMRPRVAGAPIRAGDYVDVELLVTTPVSREQVVLDDPIPAGFEPVNLRFSTTTREVLPNDASGAPFSHREMRDDRVLTFLDRLPAGSHRYSYLLRATTAGRYGVPPAKAECMYAPDVYGRTAAGVVDVR